MRLLFKLHKIWSVDFHWIIIKIDATKCQILRLKCIKIVFGWGSAPDPAEAAYSAPQDPLAGRGLLLREGDMGREGKGRKGRGRQGKGRKGEGGDPNILLHPSFLEICLVSVGIGV